MKYLQRSIEGILIQEEKVKYSTKGLKKYINELCVKNLSTFEGREQAASILLNITSNLPIYVDEKTILFPTKSIRNYDCIYLNYHKILSVSDSENGLTKVIFVDLSELVLTVNSKKIKRQFSRANTIFELKNSY